jgi:hypothetical protein
VAVVNASETGWMESATCRQRLMLKPAVAARDGTEDGHGPRDEEMLEELDELEEDPEALDLHQRRVYASCDASRRLETAALHGQLAGGPLGGLVVVARAASSPM